MVAAEEPCSAVSPRAASRPTVIMTNSLAYIFLSITFISAVTLSKSKVKSDYQDKSLWKKEFEDELTDAMLSARKNENITRVTQSANTENEAVIEKLMETITSSEKYLKKVDSLDFRLNRLDIEVHEKTNSILKYLMELKSSAKDQSLFDKLDLVKKSLKEDIGHVKLLLETTPRAFGDGQMSGNSAVDGRIAYMEGALKNIGAGVDSILATISEVKNKQNARPMSFKTDGVAAGVGHADALSLISEFRRSILEQKIKKCDCKQLGMRSERYPTDCHEIQMQGFNVSGIYKIKPDDSEPFYALCDFSSSGGGWTVFQNRFDGTQDFYKSWWDYKHGFGNLAGEFWLGLEKLHYLTNQKLYEIRIEVETRLGQDAFAGYSVFTVGPEHEAYRISTLGTYYGTAGDSLTYHAGQKFSTFDTDNDEWKDGSCAAEHGGAWWYKECDKSNLNGKFSQSGDELSRSQSIYWISFKGPNYPLSKTKMMIRPLPASRPTEYSEQTRKNLESPKIRHREKTRKDKGYEIRGRSSYLYDGEPHAAPYFASYP